MTSRPGTLAMSTHVPVERGAVFSLNNRRGRVAEMQLTTCLVVWEEFVDPETGEVMPGLAEVIPHERFCHYDRHGRLHILNRPSAAAAGPDRSRVHRTQSELRRMRQRLCHVEAAISLVKRGELEETRAGFFAMEDHILGLGARYYQNFLATASGATGKRGGARVNLGEQGAAIKSAAIVFNWYRKYLHAGEKALFDHLSSSGNRTKRYDEDERALLRSVIDARLDEERCTVSSIVESARAAFLVHNDAAALQHPPGRPLVCPGYDYIRDTISELAPIDHAIRTRGLKVAYRDMHALGVGVRTERALERVETDEYTVDLMVLLASVGVWDWLRPDERALLGLDGSVKRVVMSAAIDVHTRCIVAMKISAAPTASILRDTVEMIFLDKSPVADAVGAHEPWNMHGRPEMIVMDRGPNYIGDEVYDLLAALGITNMGAPARKPWLRPFIERLFRTIHTGLLQRFSGRTFSDVVAKGENDAAARASLPLDNFLHWLVRWIVDVYHNTPHAGLGGRSPAEAWRHAQTVSPLQSVSREEMRLVFGIREKRKLDRSGIRMMHIDYQTDELARIFNAGGAGKTFEVAWWPHDIGAISVKVRPEHWLTVTAADPMWTGRSFDDLLILRHSSGAERDQSNAVRARALVDIDAAGHRGKALRGLLPTIVTGATFTKYEADFKRFMTTAEREFDQPEHTDLFDFVIAAGPDGPAPETSHAADKPASQPSEGLSDDDDIME